jgi:hypothetical protein
MPYLNAVVILETPLAAHLVSGLIHDIEERLGREREEDRFAPRTIDIDILYAGIPFRTIRTLTLPHPRWAQATLRPPAARGSATGSADSRIKARPSQNISRPYPRAARPCHRIPEP